MIFNFWPSLKVNELSHRLLIGLSNLIKTLFLIFRYFYFCLNFLLFFSSLSQIEAADKQLKATRQFLEDQAAEREQERDEFSKEIEKLRVIVKEKNKDITSQDNHQKEVLHFSLT